MSLGKKQLIALNELFETGGDEAAVLKKHNIARSLWAKWLADKKFADEMAARMDAMKRQSGIIIAKYAPFAAAKLIELCSSENQETARKAALDILNLQTDQPETSKLKPEISDTAPPSITPETASKLLAVLAENK